jgi:hypothetical protein
MTDFNNKLKKNTDLHSLSGVSEERIKEAEEKLKLKFAAEYRKYLLEFGVASAFGHEFTGLCEFPRLNVVEKTIKERENNKNIPDNLYLIEHANIDGIIVWQSETGFVYITRYNTHPEKISNSLAEYIDL